MNEVWNWPGSRWWRVDLHTHSPASYDFKPEVDRVAKDWAKWVASAKEAGLHAVALTDHNTPDGIAEIQKAAAEGDLTVFPGIEVTVGGLHLLCILDPKKPRDDVVALLANLGFEPAAYGKQDASSSKSIVEAIGLAAAAGAVVVAAHVNGPRGLLTAIDGQDRLSALKAPGLIAAEVAPIPSMPPLESGAWLDPEGSEVQDWLEGTKTKGPALARVWCSDSHKFDDLGRRFTWVKMTKPDAEGLRLALLDGSGSLRPAESGKVGDPNKHAANVIESIKVTKAKYMGRVDPLTIIFNPWLNALIGGRGTGKSTIVDFCRQALRREDELGSSSKPLRAAFDKRMKEPEGRGSEGLLTSETTVEVTYRKDGERFLLSWNSSGTATPITHLQGELRVPDTGNIRERFPVRIYSQKQLFDIASDPDALLTVIDDATDVQGAEFPRLRGEIASRYLSLRAEARALSAQAAELPTRIATLSDVRRKLEVLQKGGHAKALNQYRDRRRKDGNWQSVREAAVEAVESLARVAEHGRVADLDLGPEADRDAATAALSRAHDRLRSIVDGLHKSVLDAAEKALAEIAEIEAGEDARAWQGAVTSSNEEFGSATSQLAQEGITNPDEYRDLLQRSAALEREIGTLENRRMAAEEREKTAEEELRRYRELRSDFTARRSEFAKTNSSDQVRVEVKSSANRDNLADYLRSELVIDRYDSDHEELQRRIDATASKPWSFQGLDRVVSELRGFLADPKRTWEVKDRRFETALRKLHPERIDRLALYLPEDSVDVSFRGTGALANSWRSLEQGSPGQQTAALLAFVLGYGDEPIILDQPEDDLDNTLIYELLVSRLRETKPGRQVIVVTHNPNIVVHGDAELVVSLEVRNGQTHVAFSGGLQEEQGRSEICRVMEGGRDAFEARYRRIMLHGGRRNE